MSTDYAYLRVSTDGQETDAQRQAIGARFPGAHVVSETASGAKSRPILRALLESLRPGDRLIVYSLDRLGRKTTDVLALIEDLERRGVALVSLREGVDYSTPVGRLVTQVLVSVAELERSLISERTKAGLAAARSKGRVGGRPRSIDAERLEGALVAIESGDGLRETARRFQLSAGYLSSLWTKRRAEAAEGAKRVAAAAGAG